MVPNKIRDIRKKKGLTQRQLAEAVDSSQQQIQRIETGSQSVRFDLALKICAALDTPMERIFPKTKKTLVKSRKKDNTMEDFLSDADLKQDMEKAGVDMDPLAWTFKYRLRGGTEGFFPISSIEKKRLWRAVQRADLCIDGLYEAERNKGPPLHG